MSRSGSPPGPPPVTNPAVGDRVRCMHARVGVYLGEFAGRQLALYRRQTDAAVCVDEIDTVTPGKIPEGGVPTPGERQAAIEGLYWGLRMRGLVPGRDAR